MINLLAQSAGGVWEYGLGAGAFAALLAFTKFMFDTMTKSNKESQQGFQSTVKDLAKEHKAERDEWRADSSKREDRITSVCERLLESIHDNRNPK